MKKPGKRVAIILFIGVILLAVGPVLFAGGQDESSSAETVVFDGEIRKANIYK